MQTTLNIISINDIEKIEEYLQLASKKKNILLLDFDDTMVMTGHANAGHLGGLKWREEARKTIQILKQKYQDKLDGDRLFGYLTLFIAKAVSVCAVQPQISNMIKKWESLGCKVVIFTVRGRNGPKAWYGLNIKGIDVLTEQQMHKAGICLAQTFLPPHERIYNHSMIFCQNAPKEEIIKDLFDKKVFSKEEIDRIAFVDDKQDSVEKVKNYIETQGIPFVGAHYTAIQETEKKEYNILDATIQLINLATRKSFLSAEALEKERLAFSTQHNFTANDYFQKTLEKINSLFVDNQLYSASFEHIDPLYERISEVFLTNHASFEKWA